MWSFFSKELQKVVEKHIPFVMRRSGRRGPVWGNDASRRAIKKKQMLWRDFRRGYASRDDYKTAEKAAKKCIRRARKKFEKSLVKSSKSNPRRFYAYVNGKKNDKNKIGQIINEHGDQVGTDAEKAEAFNNVFASVFKLVQVMTSNRISFSMTYTTTS